MNERIILLLASFALGLVLINHLRTLDIHEKESFLKMSIVTIVGGVCSVILSLFLYKLIDIVGIKIKMNFVGALFLIGPIEETGKLIAFLLSYPILKKSMNEPTDGLIYMACVALGFSLIENFFYATRASDIGYLLFLRVLLSTPLHIISSMFMGLAFYMIINFNKSFTLLLLAWLYAIIIHGIFDAMLFHSISIFILGLFIKMYYDIAYTLLSYTTLKSPFQISLSQYIDQAIPKKEKGIECLQCGNKERKDTINFNQIKIQRCPVCASLISSRDSLFKIFHFFGSDFRSLGSQYWQKSSRDDDKYVLFGGNIISNKKKIGFFYLNEIERELEKFKRAKIEEIENKWWFTKSLIIPKTIT